jgi:hypothetical protein
METCKLCNDFTAKIAKYQLQGNLEGVRVMMAIRDGHLAAQHYANLETVVRWKTGEVWRVGVVTK